MHENNNENLKNAKENLETAETKKSDAVDEVEVGMAPNEAEAPNDDSDAPANEPQIDDSEEDIPQAPPKLTYRDLARAATHAEHLVNVYQQQFDQVANDYKVTPDELAQVVEYNTKVRMTKEEFDSTDHPETVKYDQFNGINNIPEDKINEIFGVNGGIKGVDHQQTIDRIRTAVIAFYSLYQAHQELDYIKGELGKIMAEQEAESMRGLREQAEHGETEEIRKAAAAKVEEYETNKYLGFLPQAGFANQKRIITALSNEGKLNYLIERARIYLKKLDVSDKFLLEISSFEKRFLPKKYHPQDNVLLILFMSLLVYEKVEQGTPARRRMIGFVLALDNFIRNKLELEDRSRVYDNIIAFEDIIFNNLGSITGAKNQQHAETTTKPADE